jgi:hypothetical protein
VQATLPLQSRRTGKCVLSSIQYAMVSRLNFRKNPNFANSRPEQVDKARAAVEKNRFNVPIPPSSGDA